ncbi:polysaccharide deacetylase family protein [Xylanibacillus composti]|uniref:NodB homology domain-containing protein n=1 Tax=Xylanibacillus composti TaxID=1572762 RepID=A0A8J4H6J4_9BACL|nr:polysaccharide deacetylase family protein [Xylanibacillus composti]MDT9726883.1 polysaccharide deacetylase family protein [Xylanibacillus composti]GIQ69804.1 hypothetical protein XYCOK13_26280 [Xylanibacillus composti]
MPFKNLFTSRKSALAALAVIVGLALLVWTSWMLLGKREKPPLEFDSANSLSQDEEQAVVLTEELGLAVDDVYTSRKRVALTFNGMADLDTMTRLLQELDKHQMRATFFLPGMRVAEEPDVVGMIAEAGHEIANNTLDQLDMSSWSAEQIVEDLQLTNELIERETGLSPRYVRTRSGDYTDEMRRAAKALGMEAVIGASINPRDRDGQSAAEIGAYVDRFLHRGAVILLNTHLNPEIVDAIGHIAEAVERQGFVAVPLGELMGEGTVRKALEEIPGHDAAQLNLDYANTDYLYITSLPNGENKIALTFDDWGSEKTINHILETLASYNVKSTFFLVGDGVERNPNLARAILDEGHEIANHTHSHKVVTTLSPEELQEDVVKAHRVLTEALQEQPLMLFRPPTGEIDENASRIIAATGYRTIVNYDVTALDWDVNNRAEDIVSTILERTVDGSIILLHLHDHIHTPEALPDVIEGLQDRGFTFVKVTELLEYAKE